MAPLFGLSEEELFEKIDKNAAFSKGIDLDISSKYIFISKKEEQKQNAPYIGDNGNWYVNGEDTHVSAQGPKGDPGGSKEKLSWAVILSC